ncbi:MAG: polysaccharide deacetylase family protein [Caldilineaceae bacterium]
MLKQLPWLVVRSPLFAAVVSKLERFDTPQPNLLRILTYHRLESPALFAVQMQHLASHYQVVSMTDLLAAYQQGKALPPRAVLLTFDDAYADFAGQAWPILQQYHLPVTLFVPTAFPDHPERLFWWDRLYAALQQTRQRDPLATPIGSLPLATAPQRTQAYKRLRDYVKSLPHTTAMPWVEQCCQALGEPEQYNDVLSWETLRQLAHAGVTLGAHTQTHPLMNRITPDAMYAEAVGSLRDLEEKIGDVAPVFAYPSGGFNQAAVNVLDQAGFALAFTTVRGLNPIPAAHKLCLRRINVGARTNLSLLRSQLLARSVILNRCWPLALEHS